MEDTKKQSVSSKKQLAEKTRNFIKMSPEEAPSAFSDLLRAYQMEIEALSKRCKFSEAEFLGIASVVATLPDPSATAASAASARSAHEDELKRFRTEFKDLESELLKMKNQEVTVRRLEGRIRELESQKKGEATAMEGEFNRRKSELEAAHAHKADRMQVEIDQLLNRNKSQEVDINEMNKSHFTEKSRTDQLIQRQQEEINGLNNQMESLREKLAISVTAPINNGATLDLYREVIDKSEERIAALEAELVKARTEMQADLSVKDKLVADLKQKLEGASGTSAAVQARMSMIANRLGQVLGLSEVTVGDLDSVLDSTKEQFMFLTSSTDTLRKRGDELLTERNRLVLELQAKVEEVDRLKSTAHSVEPVISSQSPSVSQRANPDDIVSIIQSQRDRFRARVLELESQRDALKQSQFEVDSRINVLMSEKKKLESERNFWKSQSYTSESKSGDVELGPIGGELSGSAPTLASMRRRMAGSGAQDLEQTVTSIMVWGLGNPVTRRAVLVYILTLHILVFMVLYRLSSIVSDGNQ